MYHTTFPFETIKKNFGSVPVQSNPIPHCHAPTLLSMQYIDDLHHRHLQLLNPPMTSAYPKLSGSTQSIFFPPAHNVVLALKKFSIFGTVDLAIYQMKNHL